MTLGRRSDATHSISCFLWARWHYYYNMYVPDNELSVAEMVAEVPKALKSEKCIGVSLEDLCYLTVEACGIALDALRAGYAPAGALVVDVTKNNVRDKSSIIAQASNMVRAEAGGGDSSLHAEPLAITAARRELSKSELQEIGLIVVSGLSCLRCGLLETEQLDRVAMGAQYRPPTHYFPEGSRKIHIQPYSHYLPPSQKLSPEERAEQNVLPGDEPRFMQFVVRNVLGERLAGFNGAAAQARECGDAWPEERAYQIAKAEQLLDELRNPDNWGDGSNDDLRYASGDPLWEILLQGPNFESLNPRWMGDVLLGFGAIPRGNPDVPMFERLLKDSGFGGDVVDFMSSGGNGPSREARLLVAKAYLNMPQDQYRRWKSRMREMHESGEYPYKAKYSSIG